MPKTAPNMPGKLAESAFELFSERGFDGVTIDDISARAGVTKGSCYSHYRSKHELILAACSHYYRTYQRRVQSEISRLTDPLERLRRVLEFSVRSCVIDERNRVFTTSVFALSLQDESVRQGWAQFYDTVRETYIGLVMTAEAAGQIVVEDPRFTVDLMLAAIEGVKMRAAFEMHIASRQEQQSIVAGLLGILISTTPETLCAATGTLQSNGTTGSRHE
ncbi:Biofilm operon icaADBC HTH-type negative transcriptional regulator IcaR [Planctomycetes bacterium CA13]|uniref:Biofilm operon icaADBC HTH-type negative transcriptional regulator IcaR n=1 Tax=Novipirellula herctigrandis TaxID=2527986 RepID=A0A5C5ZD20_9BACT|nr:Biofilm operon icaADBC HTH-type negative transcriptional regulator IcaR [Planctomycetes bacterium CA13]